MLLLPQPLRKWKQAGMDAAGLRGGNQGSGIMSHKY